MRDLIQEIIRFAIEPIEIEKCNSKVNRALLLNTLGILSIIIVPTIGVFYFIHNEIPPSSFEYSSRSQLILFVIFLAPVIEEVVFRYPLRSAKWSFYLCFVISWVLAGYFVNTDTQPLNSIMLSTLFFLFIATIFAKTPNIFLLFWKRYYILFFYSITLFFGLIHLQNYNFTDYTPSLVLLALFLPQTILGVILGFFRLKYGLLIAMFVHSTYNLIVLVFNCFFEFL